jgi:hypothetical protein
LSDDHEGASQSWRWVVDTDVDPQFDQSRRLIAQWRKKRRGAILPLRTDLDPASIGWLIKNLFVVVWDPARDDFVYSYIGHEIISAFGVDNNNCTMAEAYADPEQRQAVRDAYRFILQAERPFTTAGQVWSIDGAWATFEAVHLPVREPPDRKTIIGGMFFIDAVEAEASSP